jgi:orotate phosphoribosyltransferase
MQGQLVTNSDTQDLKTKLFELIKDFSIENREVTLTSGLRSTIYIDCRQVYFRGEVQFILGELFFKKMLKIECESNGFDACGGMAMGSIPLSCALSSAAFRRGRELPGFAIRKEAKEHGMMSVIEGSACLLPHSRILIVEDVITTGSSALKAVTELRALGMCVDTLFAIVDRDQGGYENLLRNGVQPYSLFTLKDFLDT